MLEKRTTERMENLTLAELFARDDPNHQEVTEQRRHEIREQMTRAEQLEAAFAHEDDGEEGCLICHL